MSKIFFDLSWEGLKEFNSLIGFVIKNNQLNFPEKKRCF